MLSTTSFLMILAFGIVEDVGPNRADEPFAKTMSIKNAVAFVDHTTVRWQKNRNCVTCHTNGLYMVSRSSVYPSSIEAKRAREFAKSYLRKYLVDGQESRGQRGSIEGIVSTVSFLAIGEKAAAGQLSEFSERALKHILAIQDKNGAWPGWLKCHWGPYEVDDHFGATLAAVALGKTSPEFRADPTVKDGMEKLRRFLKKHKPENAHQKGMMLWASESWPNLATEVQRVRWKNELLKLQHDDGGWNIVELGDDNWKREDNLKQDKSSDGYATAFAIFILRKSGMKSETPEIKAALLWLDSNQRESGRWFTRSPRRDGKHYITHAATHFAILALHSCGMVELSHAPDDK